MAIRDGFPAESGAVDQIELRRNLAGLIVRDTSGAARPGVFPRHSNVLVAAVPGTMNVSVAAFEAAAVRAGGPVFLHNDGPSNVAVPTTTANSKYTIVYARQNENGYGGLADGSNGAVLDKVSGAESASPSLATAIALVPTGGIPLAAVLVPSTATATNSAGVVITQLFDYTAVTGTSIWRRSKAEIDAMTSYSQGTRAYDISTGNTYEYFALYNSVTNPGGATPAGWYHVGGHPGADTVTFGGLYSADATSPLAVYGQAGRVFLDGAFTSGAATFAANSVYSVGSLQAALAPAKQLKLLATWGDTGIAQLVVNTDGTITIRFFTAPGSVGAGVLIVHLNGLSWRLKAL